MSRAPGRPRIVFCAHGGERTGPPVLLLRFARWLDAQDLVDQSFVLLDDGPLAADFAEIGPTIVLDEFRPPLRLQAVESVLFRVPGAGRRLAEGARRRFLRRRLRPLAEPDLVYVNTAGSVRALRYLDLGDATVVTQVHELSVGLTFWLDPDDLALLLEVSEELLVVSHAVGRVLTEAHGADPDRIVLHRGYVSPAPVDQRAVDSCRAQLGLAPDSVLVGACGTVDWRKAPDLFVRLAEKVWLRAEGVDVRFVWLGGTPSSPLADTFAADVAASPIADRITIVPETADPMPWFGAMDVFTLPAREDAYPLVCLEAASVGVPLVCFDNGGMPEFVADTGGGVTVPYPDLDAFADAVARLVTDDAGREQMGRAAAAGVESGHTVASAGPALWEQLAPWVR